jgi:hypothetical protein
MSIDTLEDLEQLLEEVDKRGFRARFLDPNAPDPTEYQYLPAESKDGVKEHELPELLAKVRKVATVRKWVDILGVGPDLEPVTGNSVAYTAPSALAGQPSVEEILASARIGIDPSELPKTPFTPFDEEDQFDRLCEKVAKAYGVSLSRLRREALSEDISGVENLQQALAQVAESIKAQA